MWCSICGASANNVRLFDMVGQSEIVKVCERCAAHEKMPVIKKATEFQIKQAEKRPSMHERISGSRFMVEKEETRRTNEALKQVVNRNYTSNLPKERKVRTDLVPNFYWGIMRVRRARKVTQEQMAKALGVPEAAIRLAEQGILPENDYVLARKIENYLGVKIIKPGIEAAKTPEEKHMDRLAGINPKFTSGIKIADLQRKDAELAWGDEDDFEEDTKERDEEEK